jgi:hypothetical protein
MHSSRMSQTSERSFSTSFFARLDGRREAPLLQLVVDEGLEQLERHLLRQAALVQLELRAHHDDRAARVVHALAEEVLPEAALLALEHVAQRLQRALVGTGDGLAAAAVVEEGVDGLLQHPLLVADDDLRRVELLQPLEAVVAVDHAAVEVVEVARGEAAAVEGHERAQVGRQHGDDREHHPLGPVARLAEGLDHLQALGVLLPLGVRGGRAHVRAEILGEAGDVHLLEQLQHGVAAHLGHEGVVAVLVKAPPQGVLRENLTQLEGRGLRVGHHVGFAVENLLQVAQGHVEHGPDAGGQALQKPDVRHRGGQGDVPQALAAHLGLNHLDAALLAHDVTVLHALVLAAVALVVLHRTKDLRAEEPIPLGLERAVVDGLGLLHLAPRPLLDLLRRRERNTNRAKRQRILGLLQEVEDVLHDRLLSCGGRLRGACCARRSPCEGARRGPSV